MLSDPLLIFGDVASVLRMLALRPLFSTFFYSFLFACIAAYGVHFLEFAFAFFATSDPRDTFFLGLPCSSLEWLNLV